MNPRHGYSAYLHVFSTLIRKNSTLVRASIAALLAETIGAFILVWLVWGWKGVLALENWMLLVSASFFAFGGFMFLVFAYKAIQDSDASGKLSGRTVGVVKEAHLEEHLGQSGAMLAQPVVSYQYTVAGSEQGGSHLVSTGWHNINLLHQLVLARYQPGTEVDVFYDPEHPDVSSLKRHWEIKGRLAAIVGWSVFLAGWGMMAGGLVLGMAVLYKLGAN